MNAKIILALVIAGGIAAWMATGTLVVSGTAQEATPRPPAERSEANDAPFSVRVATLTAVDRPRSLKMRGRTRADALVSVAAETGARIAERLAHRGTKVEPGDVLCRLEEGARAAQLAQAKAEAARAQLDFDAATKLRGRGFESETRVATTRAELDAAQASVAAAELELARTVVEAPIAGIVQEPIAEVGARLAVGDVCATIVDADPIVITGQVSERDISQVREGVTAEITLVTGESVKGTVVFISRTADADTRTFTVEIHVPNPDGTLRAGVTAEARIPLPAIKAHRLSPGILTLADNGAVGVRTVGEDDKVAFMPVKIVMQDTEGFWVTGLPDVVTVITVGQDYVIDGQTVDPVKEANDA
ncbi:efflux RND transporter periplasmic adaptor subunit [Acuticoccus mangrovi]|uniref:Efflux RND transporter periplasmic adaptor subunit n=1 Tax=Acuticoccus mangrovi TaxID=2796142 RepID=A0A934IJ67_9HYPH|nr:efflux RND transporter periplasmic adaptor subunit [Acuticoccus mangrovi]MBJ3777453.1 efflux RND transporter periplasmic adaptor subunit [Acuticoccus mangrovi]